MKTKPINQKRALRHGLISALAGMALMSLPSPVQADDLVVSTFDYGLNVAWNSWRDYVTGHDQVWDPLVDADGNPASGAMYVTVNWPLRSDPNWNADWHDVQAAFSVPTINSADYIELEASIKIDVANSFPAQDGGYGVAGLYVNGGAGGWKEVQGYFNLNATTNWQRIHGFMSAVPASTYSEVVIGLISNGGSSLTNTVAYWIDNIRITAPPSVNTNQPPLTIAKAPPAGLTCIASMPGDAWQRQMVRTVTSDFSWHTATASSNTTTYALNIADFPGAAYAGFEAMVYLIPLAGMAASGPDGSSVDWDSSHVAYFTISANADGTAKGNFRYKVNCPSAENFRSWTDLACASGPLGTWSLAVNYNTNVTMRAPNGSNTTFTIPEADAANFQGPLIAYFGVRPADSARIGQSATFGRIQIAGAAASLDDSFTQGPPYILDPNTWVRKASSPQGLFITAPDAKYWVSWPTPDSGFVNLYATEDLARQLGNNQWLALPAAATGWLEVGGNKRLAVINQSALNTAFGHSPARCFFGLWQVTP